MNGFRAREAQLRQYITEQGGNCIFAFSDTRLKENVTVKKFKGYSLLRCDKSYTSEMATAGGVGLLVPENWTIKKLGRICPGNQCES